MARIVKILVPLMMAALPTLVSATEERTVLPMREVEAYVKTALKYSRFDRVRGLPVVIIVPQKELQDEVCGGAPCPIAGLFHTEKPGMVRVIAEQSPTSLRNSIVHEIVHWIQFRHGLLQDRTSCANARAREAEAYTTAYVYSVTELGETGAFWYPLAPCPSDLVKP